MPIRRPSTSIKPKTVGPNSGFSFRRNPETGVLLSKRRLNGGAEFTRFHSFLKNWVMLTAGQVVHVVAIRKLIDCIDDGVQFDFRVDSLAKRARLLEDSIGR